MPSQRDPQEPQDPIEDDDLVGAGEDDAEEADDEDDDILDEEQDELDDDVEEETDDESVATDGERESITGEVGSEGGSPGETTRLRHDRGGLGRGSEATTTREGGRDDTPELRDDDGAPVRRAP